MCKSLLHIYFTAESPDSHTHTHVNTPGKLLHLSHDIYGVYECRKPFQQLVLYIVFCHYTFWCYYMFLLPQWQNVSYLKQQLQQDVISPLYSVKRSLMLLEPKKKTLFLSTSTIHVKSHLHICNSKVYRAVEGNIKHCEQRNLIKELHEITKANACKMSETLEVFTKEWMTACKTAKNKVFRSSQLLIHNMKESTTAKTTTCS